MSSRSPGRFFADEIAAPLGLDFFVGLPVGERDRVSRVAYQRPDVDLTILPAESVPEELREQVTAWRDPNSFSHRAYAVTDPAAIDFDSPEVQAAELTASNGIGTARALARMYAALIGEVDGVRLLSSAVLASAAEEQAGGKDQVMLIPSRFSAGYMLPTESNPMIGPTSFGRTGRGGSLAFADSEHGVAFGARDEQHHWGYGRRPRGISDRRGAKVARVRARSGMAPPESMSVRSTVPAAAPPTAGAQSRWKPPLERR